MEKVVRTPFAAEDNANHGSSTSRTWPILIIAVQDGRSAAVEGFHWSSDRPTSYSAPTLRRVDEARNKSRGLFSLKAHHRIPTAKQKTNPVLETFRFPWHAYYRCINVLVWFCALLCPAAFSRPPQILPASPVPLCTITFKRYATALQ